MKNHFIGSVLMAMLCLSGCSTPAIKNITLTFIQHSYIKDDQESHGYYFKNDQIAVTELSYEKGFNLDEAEIDNLYKKVRYEVPELNGDGYWRFTFFTKNFDESTGYSNDFLEAQILNENLTIHFAIYG